MKLFNTALAAILLSLPLGSVAQQQRSPEFKQKYQLKEAVVLSRHNIRSPLSDSKSDLGRMTPHQWTVWSAPKSELTLRGGAVETMMGQYFRKWAEDAGDSSGIGPEKRLRKTRQTGRSANKKPP